MPESPVLPGSRSGAEPPSTRALLRSLKSDPDLAWQGLLLRTRSRLAILVSFRMDARLRALADPDDLLQDVWLEAMGCMERFEYRGPGSLQRWLAGILRNKLHELARMGERRASQDATSPEERSEQRRLLERLTSAASRDARQRELEARVRDVLADLPEPEREALLMRVYEGLSVREAARMAGVDPAAISRRTTRALERCALRLKGFE